MSNIYKKTILLSFLCFFMFASCQTSQNSGGLDLRDRVRRVVLKNGMKFLLLKREGAPVFSTQMKFKVGNIEEEPGLYGLAHFFEHMAFKGTEKIGSKDFAKENVILEEIFKVGTELVEMKKKGVKPEVYEALLKKRLALEKQQNEFIEKNEFTRIYQRNGGLNLNASTSNDYTTYYVSLPVNKLELWAYMESERLKKPVLREFFTERDVVAEERRMRIDNTAQGKIYEAFMKTAFDYSPYKTVVIGPADNIQSYTPKKAQEFYEKYYIPSRLVVALVGNFELDDAEATVKKYFGPIPAKKDTVKKIKPQDFSKGKFPREVTLKEPERSRFYLGYHRPAHPSPDDIVFDVIQSVLCDGRTSRLFKKFVLEKKIASSVACYGAIPGARLDALFTFYGMPLDGHSNKELRKGVLDEIAKFAEEGPTDYELEKVKNSIDANFVYSLSSNSGLASQLAFYECLDDDWQYIYRMQKRVHEITAKDIKRVVKKYFVKEREVTAYIEQKGS